MKYYFLPSPTGMMLITVSKTESIFRCLTPTGKVISSPVSNEDTIPMIGSVMGPKEEKILNDFIKK